MHNEKKLDFRLKAILVDDETPANEALKTLLELVCPHVRVMEMCISTAKAAEAIIRHQPDVVFLDIQMPHESGIDFLKRLGDFDFEVVFVTAFSHYAIDAFHLSSVDYLLKPVNIESVITAVEKVGIRRQQKRNLEHYKVLIDTLYGNGGHIMLPDKNGIYIVVQINDICYCKADKHATHFYLTQKRHLITGTNLGEYKSALLPYQFLQTHRSYIVNMKLVEKYNAPEEILLLSSGYEAPVGGEFKPSVMAYLRGEKN
jgi:two-component system, LytTR family, response regulator